MDVEDESTRRVPHLLDFGFFFRNPAAKAANPTPNNVNVVGSGKEAVEREPDEVGELGVI